MTEEEKAAKGIKNLPASLKEALGQFEKSEFIKSVLGDHTAGKYLEAKNAEWNQYTVQVSQWELDQYLHRI
jgi:glutamine synthetase